MQSNPVSFWVKLPCNHQDYLPALSRSFQGHLVATGVTAHTDRPLKLKFANVLSCKRHILKLEKLAKGEESKNNKNQNLHMTSHPWFQPWPLWLDAISLTSAPSLSSNHHLSIHFNIFIYMLTAKVFHFLPLTFHSSITPVTCWYLPHTTSSVANIVKDLVQPRRLLIWFTSQLILFKTK